MAKKFLIIFLCITIISLASYHYADAIGLKSLVKVVTLIKKVADNIKKIRRVSRALDNVPHTFPFGGHITSSKRACSFRGIYWQTIYYFGVPVGTPFPIYIPLPGRAIEVGPPLASPGRMMIFPYISDVYRNNAEKKVGPWALGLGFTPFPLKEINEALDSITVVLVGPIGASCGPQQGYEGVQSCANNFSFDCSGASSGDKDASGNDIYKVILKLGTSPK